MDVSQVNDQQRPADLDDLRPHCSVDHDESAAFNASSSVSCTYYCLPVDPIGNAKAGASAIASNMRGTRGKVLQLRDGERRRARYGSLKWVHQWITGTTPQASQHRQSTRHRKGDAHSTEWR